MQTVLNTNIPKKKMAEVTDVMGNLKYQIHVFYDRLLYKSTFTWKNVVDWRHFCQEGWFGGFGLSECAELFSKLDLSSCVQSPQRSFVGLEANKCWTTALSTETQDGRFQNWLESEPEFVTANLKTSVLTLAEYSYCILSKFNIITTYSI